MISYRPMYHSDNLNKNAWQSTCVHPTMLKRGQEAVDGDVDRVDLLLQVSSNLDNALLNFFQLVVDYKVNIKSGIGSRLTEITGGLMHVSVPAEHKDEFVRNLELCYQSDSKRLQTSEEFERVPMRLSNFELDVSVENDTPGVLAELMLKMSEYGVNVVSMNAATGGAPGASKGWANARLFVPDHVFYGEMNRLSSELEELRRARGWALTLRDRDGKVYVGTPGVLGNCGSAS